MFDLELAWDRPARTGPAPTQHTLRIRIRPNGALTGLPVHLAVALDTSRSMESAKLDAARAACRAIITRLRSEDRISLAGFATAVQVILTGRSRLDGAAAAEEGVSRLQPGGTTRTDLALDWIAAVLRAPAAFSRDAGAPYPDETGAARIGVLITDGHPTDFQGLNLQDVGPLLDRAGVMAAMGIVLWTVGLGDAAAFNTAFLVELSNRGKGAFLHAPTPGELGDALIARLGPAQALAAAHARLYLRPMAAGIRITGCCRLRPGYLPLRLSSGLDGVEADLGPLSAEAHTDLLAGVEMAPPGLGGATGEREVVEVRLAAGPPSETALTRSMLASIQDTESYREAQHIDPEVDTDRIVWEINACGEELNRAPHPRRTGLLLTRIQESARAAGMEEVARRAEEQLDDLKRTGRLNANRATGLLTLARDTR